MLEPKRVTAGTAGRRGRAVLTRIGSALVAGIVLATALAVSVFLFAALLTAGLALLAYILWKTRPLRRRMREASAGGRIVEGEVVEGETTSRPNTEPMDRDRGI